MGNRCLTVVCGLAVVASGALGADEKTKPGWSHESELSVARATGNTETETYSAKQVTAYRLSAQVFRLTGRYLFGSARGVENARNWAAALRYERDFGRDFGAYATHGWEGDVFAGFETRATLGAGGRYYFYDVDREKEYVFGELGYTFAHEERVPAAAVPALTSHFLRAYAEGVVPVTETTSLRGSFELLQDLGHGDNLQFNFDASVAVRMTKILSLKAGYAGRFRKTPAVPGNRGFDALLSMGLLAKF